MDVLAQFATPDFRRDPYPFLKWLRDNDPVHRTSRGFYLVSRHADALAVQRGTGELFRSPDRDCLAEQLPNALKHPSAAFQLDAMILKNPPEHAQLRRTVAWAFTPRNVARLHARISARCDELLDAVAQQLRDGVVVDLHRELSSALTIHVIGEMIGIPESDYRWLAPVVTDFVAALGGLSEDTLTIADEHTARLSKYFRELIAQRRRAPQPDLVSELAIAADTAPRRLSEDEIVSMLLLLWIAGFETATAGIDHGVLALINHPEQRHWLVRDRAAFTEELLRYNGPALFTPVQRIAATSVELSGIRLPAGSDVRPVFAAANRDPEVFTDPDSFDPSRDASASLAFGHGIHHCLGAFLGRAEIQIALTAVHARLPALTLAAPPKWGTALPMHAPITLPVVDETYA